ncbi:26S proteasome non-ATPase regulatory subunit 2 [Folsomia candida]|uniref:26S proteasome non-ATPase regulatory subunit 2 n=1 Tax=Folsomia candida TaxID=158441 RepID=UPI000B8F9EEE|nr:26S proteasome non-ATPase regulatory subunit 2 [Folsomia candida]XP_021943716.1 26S proteasome non-ATPase regulatory subunit 2 [Folsomia candida]
MADVTKKAPTEDVAKAKEDKDKKTDKNKKLEPEELSEEDKLLQDELDLCVERLQDPDTSLYDGALEIMRAQIKASTTSMTSVPKPLKFLRKHYQTIKDIHAKIENQKTKQNCAEIVSVLAMTCTEGRDCLNYKLFGIEGEIGEWGHEYVRHLSGEIAEEWETKDLDRTRKDKLLVLAEKIIPYNLNHNAEAEACDLAMEIEHLELLENFVDEDSHLRVCAYMTSCVAYVPDPENTELLKASLRIFKKFRQWPRALRVAMQLNDATLVEGLLSDCTDPSVRKQLAYMIGRQQIHTVIPPEIEQQDELTEITTNSHLNNNFLALGRELDILEPKTPDEVYKTNLDGPKANFSTQVDSARQNLAASFVSGFVNAGFGRDKLLTEDGNKWLYKNKEHGMLSATASLGLILLWDVDGGLGQIDKYLYSAEDYIKAGALLACGIVNCGVRNECDPALALLSDYVTHQSQTMKIGSILGLGLAYAGTKREDIITLLSPVVLDGNVGVEVMGLAALSCGLIAVGTCDATVTQLLLQCLMERTELELKDPTAKYIALGLGLNFLGKQEQAEIALVSLEVIPDPFKSMAMTLVEVCAYAGTGNVLKIQKLLHICSEHYEATAQDAKTKDDEKRKSKESKSKEKKSSSDDKEKPGTSASKDKVTKEKEAVPVDLSTQQSVAAMGIALIAMGEDVGTEMAFRSFGHLLRYCEPAIRKAVPLALALLSVSNPRLTVLDTLSKFSHDIDSEVALNSIFAMGIVGAGTNNARVAAMLRQLSQYHAKDSNNLFMVRIAQGLVHLGKGTMSLSPFHSDRQLMCPVALAGLLSTLVAFLDVRGTILGRGHYMLYCLATAMNPRMLATFDENLKPLPVPVRVGQALDTVGVAGKPKTITGFQTYTTPVLLGHGERAELATEDYIPLSPILEGFVILRKNPEATN